MSARLRSLHGHYAMEYPTLIGGRAPIPLAPKGGLSTAPRGERSFEEQCEAAWQNVFRVLESADMGPEDVLRANMYFVRAEDLEPIRKVRAKMTSEFPTGSTLLRVAALASPDWLIEIEVTAAKV